MDPMDEPTGSLVRRAQARDENALAIVFDRYRERLRAALRRMVGDLALRGQMDSEDAVQDAMLAALRGIDSYDPRERGSFLAWLLETARNELLQRRRAARALKRGGGRRPEANDFEAVPGRDPTPSQHAQARELERRIGAALARMPERERQVMVLRRYLDADFEEIRAELSLASAGAARALLSRAQLRLARLLVDGEDAGP